MIRAPAAGIEDHKRPQGVTVKVVRRMQKTPVNLGNERQLVEILDRLTGRVADNLAVCAAPYETLDRGQIGSTGLRCQPVSNSVFVLADRNGFNGGRHRQRFPWQCGDVTANHQYMQRGARGNESFDDADVIENTWRGCIADYRLNVLRGDAVDHRLNRIPCSRRVDQINIVSVLNSDTRGRG